MSDRDLVMRWVRAWAHVRGAEISQVDGWPLVHVNGASRDTEIVCVDPGLGAFRRLAARASRTPREMLTVIGRDLADYTTAPLPSGLSVDRDDEVLMTTTLARGQVSQPDGLVPRWSVDGSRATYTLDDGERVAAEGWVGVLGSDATFDRIETSPSHRRQGLASTVMTALTTWAVEHGATTGLLAATADGARLYSALGWDTRLRMWSLMSARP